MLNIISAIHIPFTSVGCKNTWRHSWCLADRQGQETRNCFADKAVVDRQRRERCIAVSPSFRTHGWTYGQIPLDTRSALISSIVTNF